MKKNPKVANSKPSKFIRAIKTTSKWLNDRVFGVVFMSSYYFPAPISTIKTMHGLDEELHRVTTRLKRKRWFGKITTLTCIVLYIFVVAMSLLEAVLPFVRSDSENGVAAQTWEETTQKLMSAGVLVFVMTLLLFALFIMSKLSSGPDYAIMQDRKMALEAEIKKRELYESLGSSRQDEARAWRRFDYQQTMFVDQYYKTNLAQARHIFWVGIFIIAVGSVTVVASIIAGFTTQNLVSAVTGGLGGALIDGVGAIFMNIYNKSIRTMSEFHNSLMRSNDVLMANVVAERIGSKKTRDETLAEIARDLVRR